MNEQITTSRQQLADAFLYWLKDAQANPDSFLQQGEFDIATYGTDCADYLIGALKDVQ